MIVVSKEILAKLKKYYETEPLHFEEPTHTFIKKNLPKTLEEIIPFILTEGSDKYDTLKENDELDTPEFKNRSLEGIYGLLKTYKPSSLQEVMRTLAKICNNYKLTTFVCGDIERRVYPTLRKRLGNDYLSRKDEFGLIFIDYTNIEIPF